MHLYSHLVIASELLPELQPDNLPEYYWGAVAADVRYLAGLPRRRTHPPLAEVRAWGSLPGLASFGAGCLVHALADERDAAGWLYAGLPRPLRRRMPRALAAVLLEAAYAERVRVTLQISGSYNAVLAGLGVPPEAAAAYAAAANRYAAAPSLEMALAMLAELGLQGSPRLQRYLGLAQLLQRFPPLRRGLMRAVDTNRITARIVNDLRTYL
jgi:hypothetical protein